MQLTCRPKKHAVNFEHWRIVFAWWPTPVREVNGKTELRWLEFVWMRNNVDDEGNWAGGFKSHRIYAPGHDLKFCSETGYWEAVALPGPQRPGFNEKDPSQCYHCAAPTSHC